MRKPEHIRLLNQQLYAPEFSTPEEVVGWFGAMQGQEYKMMRHAVTMRTKNPSLAEFKRSFDEGKILRSHLLRCTWQLVTPEDYVWMQPLCCGKALTTMNGWMHANRIYIDEDEEARIREILLEAAEGHDAMTNVDFKRALEERGIVMDDHRVSYHIRLSELKGYLTSGKLDDRKATYALVSERIPKSASQPPGREEALALLARKYFRSHAPATLEDFVWWSGLNVGDCRRAMASLGDWLHPEMFKGRTFYLPECSRTKGYRSGRTLFLAPYDEYLIGYKSRDLVLSEDFRPRAHNNSGIFYPVVAKDGIICENWKP